MKKILTLFVFTLSVVKCLFSQAPQGINYQAVIRDASGTIIANQPIGLKINIRQGAPSGTVVYAETFTPITNQFGLVNVVIGQGTVVLGIFSSISWGTNTFYSETLLDTSGGTNYVSMGTQQMISVPYALYANKSDTATFALTSSGANNSGGVVGVFEQVKPIPSGNGVVAATSTSDGSILFIVETTTVSGYGYYQVSKYIRDVNTGTYIASNSTVIPNTYIDPLSNTKIGIAVIDTTVYISGAYNNWDIWSTNINFNTSGLVNIVGYSTTNVTHPLYSDGSALYMGVWNSGTSTDSIVKFTVLGTGNAIVYSASYPFQPQYINGVEDVYFFSDGNYLYDAEPYENVNKYSLTGSFISSGDPTETNTVGLAYINSSLLFMISFNNTNSSLILEPISKP